MQLYSGLLRPGETAAAEDSDGHVEIAPKLLAHHVRRNLRCTEDGVQATIDRHGLINSIQAAGVIVALFLLDQRQRVRPVAINFVGAGKTERGFWTEIPCGNQQIHGSDGIHIEIVVRNTGGLVVRGLSCGVDHEIRPFPFEQIADALPVPNIQRQVPVVRKRMLELFHHGGGGALRPKELPAHVVVDAGHVPIVFRKQTNTLGTH